MATEHQLEHWWNTLADDDRHQLHQAIGAYKVTIRNSGITQPTIDLLNRTHCPVTSGMHKLGDQPSFAYSWPPDLENFITQHRG